MGINKFITFVDKHVLQEFSGKGQHLPLLPSISSASDNRDYVFLLLGNYSSLRFLGSKRKRSTKGVVKVPVLSYFLAVLRIQAGDLERILLMPGGH